MRSRWLLLAAIVALAAPLAAPGRSAAAPSPGAVIWARAPVSASPSFEWWDFACAGRDGSVFLAGLRQASAGSPSGLLRVGRYASNGDLLWSRTWRGAGLDGVGDAAVDRSGNLYVVATAFRDGTSLESRDVVVLKYSAGGTFRWARWFGGVGEVADRGAAVEVDAVGNVYVAASQTNADTGLDIMVLKLTSAGGLRYRTFYRGPLGDWAAALALDGSGNAYVTGHAGLADGSIRGVIMKVAPGGARLWAHRLALPWSAPTVIRVRAGAVYVAGQAGGPNMVFCGKYAPSGSRLWLKTWQSGAGSQWADGLAVDSRGGAYLIGHDVTAGPTSYGASFLVKWGSGGALVWKRTGLQLHSTLGADLSAVIAAPGDRIYVGGSVYDPGSGDRDVLVSRYTVAGGRVWSRRWDAPDHRPNVCRALAYGTRLDGAAFLYAAGWSHEGGPSEQDVLVLRLQP